MDEMKAAFAAVAAVEVIVNEEMGEAHVRIAARVEHGGLSKLATMIALVQFASGEAAAFRELLLAVVRNGGDMPKAFKDVFGKDEPALQQSADEFQVALDRAKRMMELH